MRGSFSVGSFCGPKAITPQTPERSADDTNCRGTSTPGWKGMVANFATSLSRSLRARVLKRAGTENCKVRRSIADR